MGHFVSPMGSHLLYIYPKVWESSSLGHLLTLLTICREYHWIFYKATNFEKQLLSTSCLFWRRFLKFFYLTGMIVPYMNSHGSVIYFLFQGVPSLFSDLSPLYDHPGKVIISTFYYLRSYLLKLIDTWCSLLYFYQECSCCGYNFLFGALMQADILQQLFLYLEHSVRTTGGYPGR